MTCVSLTRASRGTSVAVMARSSRPIRSPWSRSVRTSSAAITCGHWQNWCRPQSAQHASFQMLLALLQPVIDTLHTFADVCRIVDAGNRVVEPGCVRTLVLPIRLFPCGDHRLGSLSVGDQVLECRWHLPT